MEMKGYTKSTGLSMFLCVCQTAELLPDRVGQSPSDVSGGGRQMPQVDGTAGQNKQTHTHTHTVLLSPLAYTVARR